jgi:hypothetical protein
MARDDDVHEKMAAIRRGRDILHEQVVQPVVGMLIGEGEVQRPLHLPAELPCLSLSLPAGRHRRG